MRALPTINYKYIYQDTDHRLGWLINHCQYADDIREIRDNTPDLFHNIFNRISLENHPLNIVV